MSECPDHIHVYMGMNHEEPIWFGSEIDILPLGEVGYMHIFAEVIICMN